MNTAGLSREHRSWVRRGDDPRESLCGHPLTHTGTVLSRGPLRIWTLGPSATSSHHMDGSKVQEYEEE